MKKAVIIMKQKTSGKGMSLEQETIGELTFHMKIALYHQLQRELLRTK